MRHTYTSGLSRCRISNTKDWTDFADLPVIGVVLDDGGEYPKALTVLEGEAGDARDSASAYACMHANSAFFTVFDVADDGLVLQTVLLPYYHTPAEGWCGSSKLPCMHLSPFLSLSLPLPPSLSLALPSSPFLPLHPSLSVPPSQSLPLMESRNCVHLGGLGLQGHISCMCVESTDLQGQCSFVCVTHAEVKILESQSMCTGHSTFWTN